MEIRLKNKIYVRKEKHHRMQPMSTYTKNWYNQKAMLTDETES